MIITTREQTPIEVLAEAECRAETPEDMATDALRAEME